MRLKKLIFNIMEKQLPIPGFPTKEKVYPLSTSEKANFIYRNFKENMPNLYEYIMKQTKN